MSQAQWNRAKQVFHEALEQSGSKRDTFVASACGSDQQLLAQVQALLRAHDEAGAFLPSAGGETGAVARAAAIAAEMAPEGPGARIGRYKLLQSIGEGGFGQVFMAEQEEPIRRRVALKIIKLGMDTKEVIARFEAERQALAMMDHPNIAKVLDAGATDLGRPYFVMELVRGVPITEYCDTNRLDMTERLKLFVDVCRAVHHAHEKGVIHRDIKPSNVLVTLHDGTPAPMIIDFGIAKATNQRLTEKTLFTAFGQFIGTPAYMSPEQAALSHQEVDRRSDVYSLGVLLYELLTGTTPFDTDALRSAAFVEMLRVIREVDPPTPSDRLQTLRERLNDIAIRRCVAPDALAKLLRGDLDWIALHAMEKDRRRRYASAADFATDIERYFRHEPVLARRPNRAYRLQKFAKRHRVAAFAGAGVALAAVLGVALGQRGLVGPRGAESIGPTRRLVWDSADGWNVGRTTPDGRHRLRYDSKQRGFELIDLEKRTTRLLTRNGPDTTQSLPYQPLLSPDGQSIAAIVVPNPVRYDRAELRLFDVNGSGEGRRIAEWKGALRMVTAFAFSPGQTVLWMHILRMDATAEIASVNVSDGSIRTVRRFPVAIHTQPPSLSPNGGFITYQDVDSLAAPPDIFIMPTDGRPAVRFEHPSRDMLPVFTPDGSGVVFLSNRDGPNDLWFQPVADGRPAGEARKLWADASPYTQTLSFGQNGSLFYWLTADAWEIYTADIDLGRHLVAAPERISSVAGYANNAPEFSPDGEFLAHLRDRRRRVVIRHLSTGQEREYPLPSSVMSGAIDFCPDGRSLLVGAFKLPRSLALRVHLERGGVEQIDMGSRASRPVCIGDAMIYLRHEANDSFSVIRRSFDTMTETTLYRGATGGLYRSPQADQIAFTARTDSERVLVMSSNGGRPNVVASSPLQRIGPTIVLSEIQGIMWLPDGGALLLARAGLTTRTSESPEITFWRVPIDGGPSTEVGRMRLPAYKSGIWGAQNYAMHPSGTRIAFERSAGFIAQEWAIDNLLPFIRSGRSVVVPPRP